MYIYDLPEWPGFQWDAKKLARLLGDVRQRQGRLIGHMEALGFNLGREAVFHTLTQDVVKTSEIEGEHLNVEQVRSSIARRLGMDIRGSTRVGRDVEGVVDMVMDATRNFREPLSAKRLFSWHASLFPTGYSGMAKIRVGAWRNDAHGPMQVVSGPIGLEKVHFEAPAAGRVAKEMTRFLGWFNGSSALDDVLKAGLAHLWFVTIHPFDDGNGRIARAIADMQLARAEGSSHRFYSMSAQIRVERNGYYRILERTERATMDVTPWLEWFLECLGNAIQGAQKTLADVIAKARFWEFASSKPLNERQRTVLNRLVDGFEGKLTNAKWAKLAKCSPDTALRDLQHLVDQGVLVRNAEGGRSTSYSLVRPPER